MSFRSPYRSPRYLLAAFSALAFVSLGATPSPAGEPDKPMRMMGDMMTADAPVVPPVTGYSEGETILFLHTETSDAEIAQILTDMMGSPVLVVPSLAQVPEELLATVYVFQNGVQPDGPRGPLEFQPDVFDAPPRQAGYTTLRTLILVRWQNDASARVLGSAADVKRAHAGGELTFEETAIVVNMPFVTWPGGQR